MAVLSSKEKNGRLKQANPFFTLVENETLLSITLKYFVDTLKPNLKEVDLYNKDAFCWYSQHNKHVTLNVLTYFVENLKFNVNHKTDLNTTPFLYFSSHISDTSIYDYLLKSKCVFGFSTEIIHPVNYISENPNLNVGLLEYFLDKKVDLTWKNIEGNFFTQFCK